MQKNNAFSHVQRSVAHILRFHSFTEYFFANPIYIPLQVMPTLVPGCLIQTYSDAPTKVRVSSPSRTNALTGLSLNCGYRTLKPTYGTSQARSKVGVYSACSYGYVATLVSLLVCYTLP